MQFTKRIFILTLFIASLIFSVGLLLGLMLDGWRASDSDGLLSEIEIGSDSFVAESEFRGTFGMNSCEELEPGLSSLSETLAEIGKKMNDYDSKNMKDTLEFNLLKRRYFILEISTINLIRKLQEQCGKTGRNIIYFYDPDQDESVRQGHVLDRYVKALDGDINVFSFDIKFKEPALKTLKRYFKIKKSPTIIVDFKNRCEGFHDLDELNSACGK